ncbi:MAG: hypothetical protein ACTSR0_02140 [Candidatus Asgardarchaeia archaeon]
MKSEYEFCSPNCKYFRCEQRSLLIKRRNGRKVFICKWAGDACTGYKCKYASCAIGKLKYDGRCELKIRSKTHGEKYKDFSEEKMPEIPENVKGKLLKKIGKIGYENYL